MSPQPTLATTTTPATGPNPSYYQTAPVSQESIQRTEVLLHLYAYQHTQGKPNANQTVIVDPKLPACFGALAANDWTIYDGTCTNANLVAHAQGLHIGAGMTKENWFICFNMVFVDQRFMGSSFKVMGDFRGNEGEWAIVGGTGEFAYAQGVITFNKTWSAQANVRELHVRALCLSFSKAPETPCSRTPRQSSVTKIGPWGKISGEFLDVPTTPQRLECVTIRHGVVIDSLAFSFVDQAGGQHNVGPWGGPCGDNKDTIKLGPSEIVTEVSGTIGVFGAANVEYNAITSLTITTNVRTYGPFGEPQCTRFSVPVQDKSSIVGFFVCARKYVEALGVYVCPPISN